MKAAVTYDFYECQDCCLGFAVEADQVEEPACPVCGPSESRYVISRGIEMEEGKISHGRVEQ